MRVTYNAQLAAIGGRQQPYVPTRCKGRFGMKRIVFYVLGVMAVSTSLMLAQGQGGRGAPPPPPPLEPGASQADVDKALLAAPPNIRNQATVIKWKPDWTYDTLR